uniref:ClpC n=1 Tax=Schizocladia ischiensis TaxID=196139 RepID=A0A7S6ZPD9_9STRA|nr:ClpC [Schizocladia ischiensis]QOW07591.1 ClpC [Schizocladia ischiensis]
MFERFTEKALQVVMLAQEESRRLGHNFVGTEQILIGLMCEGSGVVFKSMKSYGIRVKDVRFEVERMIGRGTGFVAIEIPFTPRAKRMLEIAMEESKHFGHNFIGTEHIILALLSDPDGIVFKVLTNLGVNIPKFRIEILESMSDLAEYAEFAGSVSALERDKERRNPLGGIDQFLFDDLEVEDDFLAASTLAEFTVNLTEAVTKGQLDPVIGREMEIERVVQILSRRRKNNPILIGEPGVGKTAVAEGLALRIYNRDVPSTLYDTIVIVLDIGLLLAGTKYRGEFEERLKRILHEIKTQKDMIVVIDEVHTLVGAGAAEGSLDAANMLKPALARGEIQCIGATTIEEYRQYIEKDAALERRFQPVWVNEPSIEETVAILKGLRQRYEQHHRLEISDGAIEAAARLGAQYIADRFLPDKAIDLVDEASSRVRLINHHLPEAAIELDRELRLLLDEKDTVIREQRFERATEIRDCEAQIRSQMGAIIKSQKKVVPKFLLEALKVTENDVAHIVATWTGIPLVKLTKSETQKLLELEDLLHTRVIGQTEGVSAVARAIRRARVGMRNLNRPIASFMFSGPTGVGKTELTKALSSFFFGAEDAMVRLDMSEYMEKHTVAKLIGAPPGYVGYNEGGQLTEAVRRKPYIVVLFDEVEKAHPDIFNVLLQVLEDGRLTDSKGRIIDFKNTILIMTSNIGSSVIENVAVEGEIGFGVDSSVKETAYSKLCSLVGEELKGFFKPEFLNRIDEIIVFQQLTRDEVEEIATLMINEISERFKEKNLSLAVTTRMRARLIDEGFNPVYGARPLRRAVVRLIEDKVAAKYLEVLPDVASTVMIDVDAADRVVVEINPNADTTNNQENEEKLETQEIKIPLPLRDVDLLPPLEKKSKKEAVTI